MALREGEDASLKETILTPTYTYAVPRRPDLTPSDVSIGGADEAVLWVRIHNQGETRAEEVCVRFVDKGGELLGQTTVPFLDPDAEEEVRMPWPGRPVGRHRISVQIDPENAVEEEAEWNNVLSTSLILVTPAEGSGPVSSPDGSLTVEIPAGAVSEPTLLTLFPASVEDLLPVEHGQPDLVPAALTAYTVAFSDSIETLKRPASLSITYALDDTAAHEAALYGRLSVYTWERSLERWVRIESAIEEETGWVGTTAVWGPGTFGLFITGDRIPPSIQVHVDGHWIAEREYVSDHPLLTVLVEDENGVDVSRAGLSLRLDGTLIGSESYTSRLGSRSSNLVTVLYRPALDTGEHVFELEATDASGNRAYLAVQLLVEGDFRLAGIANHPNPFIEETVIAYTLTGAADRAVARIYTAGGRLIRTLPLDGLMGYSEIPWDGRDEEGREIANGLYYLEFTAIRGNQRIHTVEKMVKVK